MKNNVRSIRQKLKLSQTDLAKKANTSQQQIARIESGSQVCRLDLASRISAALEQPPERVFPQAAKAMGKNPQALGLNADQSALDEIAKAGIDADSHAWLLKMQLRGGHELLLPINTHEKSRLFTLLQRCNSFAGDNYVVFDSGGKRLLLNLDHVVFAHILFEAAAFAPEFEEEETEAVTAYLATSNTLLSFNVDSDSGDEGQMNSLFTMTEGGGSEDSPVLMFCDVDGEYVFLRADDVACLSVPLWVVEQIDLDAD